MVRNSAGSKKERAGRKVKEKTNKKGVKEKFVEILELPKELVMDRPKLTMIGNCDIMIENYKGIVEYDSERLRINTGAGIVKLTGTGLYIKEITSEDIIVSGTIHSLEFVNAG